jgi:hypothetical protein
LVQLWALVTLVLVGLVFSALRIPDGLARELLVACGILGAGLAATHGILSAARSRQWMSLPLALCSWATGWVLWPFWINGKHRLPNELRVFAEFPAEAVPPGIWMHKLWISTALLGWWLTIVGSSAAVLVTIGLALRGRSTPALDWIGLAALLIFWVALGASLAHALSWMLD